MADSAASQSAKARFGTFGGVFVPNVLTILGLIYFLRTGWVVGQVGMVYALLIVAIGLGFWSLLQSILKIGIPG